MGSGEKMIAMIVALSRSGKSVLHLDEKMNYGGFDGSFSLGQLTTLLEESNTELLKEKKDLIPPYFSNVIIKNYEQERLDKEEKERLEKERLEKENLEKKETEENKEEIENKEDSENKEGEENKEEVEIKVDEPSPVVVKEKTLNELGRMFSIDIAPTLLYSRGALVKLLISSSASKYLEFKSLDQNYLYINKKVHPIPSTKGSIFKDSAFSLKEKRLIMKFFESIKDLKSPEEPEKSTQLMNELSSKYQLFKDYIKSFQFTEQVESFVLYGVSLIHENLDSLSLVDGIESVFLYTSSLLVYGQSPFLLPYYGCGDIPQAFCRLCAVFGGTYVLGRTINTIQYKDNDHSNPIESVICSEGQTIKTKYLVSSPKYLNNSLLTSTTINTTKKTYSRFIGITNSRINGTEEQSFITIPPNSINNNKNVINILQFASICVPYNKGKTLIQITTLSTDNSKAEDDLKECVNVIIPNQEELLWSSFFNFTVENVDDSNNNLNNNNILVCSDSPLNATIDYEYHISQVKKLFEIISPNTPFLEKVPDSEDVIWGVEEISNDTPIQNDKEISSGELESTNEAAEIETLSTSTTYSTTTTTTTTTTTENNI
ncbi:hypothetical protein DICPUDRAFT_98103 [Dictyostelium purpureum]|uniref:Rab escort protein 1 n=1 Tax=Dictyostelium purpureum TaxID=5786 RepID=F0ZMQ2_DICPU|nr:uncharacterized protein DICPUDRAFT_98103 [Dictyostelium purpureum]EGC34784.1 hypothetical protein DICPUDRAFT_98103 [Dictyostelium purpureum]|eukprot:XP_003288699.1 hypothetical protein DICPUDRAFT_98103 [Dictyostelium purpureum]